MTNNATPSSPDKPEIQTSASHDDRPSPGQQLQSARLARAIDIADIAGELNIPVQKLIALEKDQYDALASPTFIKGYLRNYGRYLQLDVDRLIALYEHSEDAKPEEHSTRNRCTLKMKSVEKPFPEWNWAIVGGVLVFVGLAVYFLWGDHFWAASSSDFNVANNQSATGEPSTPGIADPEIADSSATPQPTEPPSNDSQSAAASAEQLGSGQTSQATLTADGNSQQNQSLGDGSSSSPEVFGSSEGAGSGEGIGPAEVNSTITSSSATVGNTAPSRADQSAIANSDVNLDANSELATGDDKLVFNFSSDCWVEVTDASGRALHQGISRADESLTIVGDAPFSIMLGNSRAASLSHNGQSVDIEPIAGRDTLRLVVGE